MSDGDGLIAVEGGPLEEDGSDGGRQEDESMLSYLRRQYESVRPVAVVTLTYLMMIVVDSGIRAIVILNAIRGGFSAFQAALMVMSFELAGVVTTVLAAVIGEGWGLPTAVRLALILEIVAISMLFAWNVIMSRAGIVGLVFVSQMLAGTGRMLVDLASKAVVRVSTARQRKEVLFIVLTWTMGVRYVLVALGFILGAALLQWSYYGALGIMLGLTAVTIPWAAFGLTQSTIRITKENLTVSALFSAKFNVTILSGAFFCLIVSRDVWFEISLPFFLLSMTGLLWSPLAAGALVAGSTLICGSIGAIAPRLILKPLGQRPPNKYASSLWLLALLTSSLFLACFVQFSQVFRAMERNRITVVLIVGVFVFAFFLAVCSSIQGHLISRYSGTDRIAMKLGVFFVAGLFGRFVGVLLGGILFTFLGDEREGLATCFWASCAFLGLSALMCLLLNDASGGLRCGPCLQCISISPEGEEESDQRLLKPSHPSSSVEESDYQTDQSVELTDTTSKSADQSDEEEDSQEILLDGESESEEDGSEKVDDEEIDDEEEDETEGGTDMSFELDNETSESLDESDLGRSKFETPRIEESEIESSTLSRGLGVFGIDDLDVIFEAGSEDSEWNTDYPSFRSEISTREFASRTGGRKRRMQRNRSRARTWFPGFDRERTKMMTPRAKSHDSGQRRQVRFSSSTTLIWKNMTLRAIERHTDPRKSHYNTIRMPTYYVNLGLLPESLIIDPSPKSHAEADEEIEVLQVEEILFDDVDEEFEEFEEVGPEHDGYGEADASLVEEKSENEIGEDGSVREGHEDNQRRADLDVEEVGYTDSGTADERDEGDVYVHDIGVIDDAGLQSSEEGNVFETSMLLSRDTDDDGDVG